MTECCGDVEQNYDGWPEWICREYHTEASAVFRHQDDFLCERCDEIREQEAAADLAENL